MSIEETAKLLKTNPDLLAEFEKAYAAGQIGAESTMNLFDMTRKDVSTIANLTDNTQNTHEELTEEDVMATAKMVDKIVADLIAITPVWKYDGKTTIKNAKALPAGETISTESISALPKAVRPQLTVDLMRRDIAHDSYLELLYNYKSYLSTTTPTKKQMYYNLFRQGLDILDLDPVTYEMLGTNHNNMGYWLPKIVDAVEFQGYFKIPKTTIIKVPMTMLQLSRCDYPDITPTTKKIINRFCHEIFELNDENEYFVKTGIFSSKYEFRNAHVKGAQEVQELGEYLMFISHQTVMMASPLNSVVRYGAATTNEWVVREYIQDKENNPCIYNGMPLHTEYRVFVDFDTQEILGVNPYWDPDIMKKRFTEYSDANENKQKHDYVVYSMHEQTMMDRYNANVKQIVMKVHELLKDCALSGQWSIDIMQNGDDFYLIDMGEASESALSHCVPAEKLHKNDENWIPDFNTIKQLPWGK